LLRDSASARPFPQHIPAGAPVERVCEEFVAASASRALKAVFQQVSGPLGAEQILQRASGVHHHESALGHNGDELACHAEVLARLADVETSGEVCALGAWRHAPSLTRFWLKHRTRRFNATMSQRHVAGVNRFAGRIAADTPSCRESRTHACRIRIPRSDTRRRTGPSFGSRATQHRQC